MPATAFATKDLGTPKDPIDTATFGNLGNLFVIATANPNKSETLGNLGVSNSITVTVTAPTAP